MSIRVIAIDDCTGSLDILRNFTSKIPWLALEYTFTKPSEAITYLNYQEVDLIFLDIEMHEMNGLELISLIRAKDAARSPHFIVTSAYDFAIEGFNLNVKDYLLKPFSYDRFLQAVGKIQAPDLPRREEALSKPGRMKYLFINYNKKLIKLKFENILYIQSDGHFVKVYTKNEKHPYIVYMQITKLEEALQGENFIRVHKSYIVNLEYITEINTTSISIENKIDTIPIGNTYRNKISDLCRQISSC